jgi:zinc protease
VAPAQPVAAEQTEASSTESGLDLQTQLSVDPKLRHGVLSNGVQFYIRVNEKPEQRAELRLAVNAGSMQEDQDQLGLAHFVEHMAFNGTTNFQKQELIDYLEGIGMKFGPDINAYTSFDETVYMLQIPTDDEETVQTAFQILEEWAHNVSLEGEEIDKERGVVVEEWRLGRGADARIRDKQFPVLFRGSRYADRLPIGDKDILEEAPYDALRRFYRDWYRPDLMAVIAVGDFDPDEIEALIRKHFEPLEGPSGRRSRELYPVPDHEETLYAITTDPEATSTSVGVYHKLAKRGSGTVGDYRRSIAEELYHSMVNSRLNEIRQQAEPPFIFAFSTSAGFVRSRDIYLQAAGVQEGEVDSGLAALLAEIERVDRFGFTQTELDRTKTELLRQYEQAYAERDKRRSGTYAGEYVRVFLEDEPTPGIERELELVRDLLPTIELAELNQLASDWITESNRVVLVSAPEKSDAPPTTEEQLAAVFQAVEADQLAPYVDRVRDTPLVATNPKAGVVTSESKIEEIGVTEWTLANGARVILKPTDFKNDQVLISAYSPGGTSLATDDQFPSASFATTLIGEGGLGEFDLVELEKALAGKIAGIDAYISELEEGIEGGASPQDLETMFQLLYLTITAPRSDPDAYQSFMARIRSFVENRSSRPEAVFGDEVLIRRYDNHPRRQPLTLDYLELIQLDTAYDHYKERFADASDFTFFMVGNFEFDSLRPLVETYIGGLPTLDRNETWRDVKATPVDGPQLVEVDKGLEPKSQVRLFWTGPAEWSRENQHDIASFANAFRIRLREVLREDMGGTYGVSVSGSISKRPEERFSLSIGFGCAPENVEEMVEAIRNEIEVVRKEGLDDSYAQKVRETQRRQRETNLKENGFWLSVLKTYYSLEIDPRLILDHESLVERVTPENIRQTAERYLAPDTVFEARLFPEDWDPKSR